MLLLKKHLVALVRAGKKHQTIRVWSRPIVRAGQISYTPGLGKMLILGVDELSGFDVLTDVDAQADGFANRAALLAELKNIYGALLPPGKQCYRIRFQWPVDGATANPAKPSLEKPVATPRLRDRAVDAPNTATNGVAVAPGRRSSAQSKIKIASKAPHHRSNSMTSVQRQKLKAFLLQPATGAAPPPKA